MVSVGVEPLGGEVADGLPVDRTASLVFGGYDASRINGSSLGFDMSNNGTLDVVVDSIALNFNNGSNPKTIPTALSGFTATIDSTTPHWYLPNATVNWLASLLHLSEYGRLFYYNSRDLEANMSLTNVAGYTMTLRSPSNSNKTLTLNFPSAALTVRSSWTYQFRSPADISLVRRAGSIGQTRNVVLGRAFFQEAYVFADFKKQSFQVAQTAYAPTAESIVAVQGDANTTISQIGGLSNRGNSLSPAAIAGTVLGCLAAVIISAYLLWLLWLKPRRNETKRTTNDSEGYTKAELDGAPVDTKEAMSEAVFEADNDFEGNELEVVQEPLPPVELDCDPQPATVQLLRHDDQV